MSESQIETGASAFLRSLAKPYEPDKPIPTDAGLQAAFRRMREEQGGYDPLDAEHEVETLRKLAEFARDWQRAGLPMGVSPRDLCPPRLVSEDAVDE